MRGFSRIVIAGNLGGDAEMRYTPSGTPVTNCSVAVNRKQSVGGGEYKDKTDWYRVSFFGKTAELADQFLRRGMPVLIDGRLEIEEWTDRDGNRRTTVQIRADNFQMLGSRDDEGGERAPATAGATAGSSGGYDDFEDVPF